MKLKEFFLFFSILGILLLILLAQIVPIKTGIIKSISYSNNKIEIRLEKQNETLIIFDSQKLNLKTGDKISFQGTPEVYKGDKQIIIRKIWKEND